MMHALWSPPPVGFGAPLGVVSGMVAYGLIVGALAAIAVGAATRVACVVFVFVSAQLGQRSPPRRDRGIDMIAADRRR